MVIKIMRTFYIFNINKETAILAKDSPYMLFKSLESIYNGNKKDLYMATSLYEQLACKIDKDSLNKSILASFKNNQHYMFNSNHHSYYNKYLDETCNVVVKNSYIICNCNNAKLNLLKALGSNNLFACDFENKDYFWLNEIYC